MKLNKIILLLTLVFITHSISAQRPGRERIKTLKIAYLTEQLSLNSEEAQQFWPVYNAHEEKMEELRFKERGQFGGRYADLTTMTDNEAEKLLSKHIEVQVKKQDMQKEYLKNLKGVISAKKIIRLFRAEDNFKKRLLQQYRKKRNGQ
jgi:hypothetical protein